MRISIILANNNRTLYKHLRESTYVIMYYQKPPGYFDYLCGLLGMAQDDVRGAWVIQCASH